MSSWNKRKPTHLAPVTTLDAPALYRCGSVLSVAPSIVSNAPSTASGSSASDVPSDSALQRAKLERLRRKLGDEVPATAVIPRTPKTATSARRSPRGRTRSIARTPTHVQPDDARSLTFSFSSDESVHRVTLSARVHSPHPPRKHIYQTGALPPVPPISAHLASSSTSRRDDDAGLVRPRQKMAAGSKIGGSDFKAARRAKREGRRTVEPGEMIEMVGFLW